MIANRKMRAVVVATPALALLMVACSSAPTTESSSTAGALAQAKGGTRVHVMPLHAGKIKSAATAPGASGAKLVYNGGKVIANVNVWNVYWGGGVQFTSHTESFWKDITTSAYMSVFDEYATPTQTIGQGSFGGAVTATGVSTTGTVTDAQVQTEIDKLISAGKLPANTDGNQLYMVYFPPGLTITGPQGSGTSCVDFCAYHGTYNSSSGSETYYGVVPDLGGSCAGGCGGSAQQDNVTSVSSHEFSEAITDAEVGLAVNATGAPLAWYDQTYGEIGDICNASQDTVDGYTVQLEWSNQQGLCVSSGTGTPPPPPTDAGTGTDSGTDGGTPPPGNTCSHDLCTAGSKLKSSCDPCAAEVCAQDSYCCGTKWDDTCVSEVAQFCAPGTTSCN